MYKTGHNIRYINDPLVPKPKALQITYPKSWESNHKGEIRESNSSFNFQKIFIIEVVCSCDSKRSPYLVYKGISFLIIFFILNR